MGWGSSNGSGLSIKPVETMSPVLFQGQNVAKNWSLYPKIRVIKSIPWIRGFRNHSVCESRFIGGSVARLDTFVDKRMKEFTKPVFNSSRVYFINLGNNEVEDPDPVIWKSYRRKAETLV